MILFDLQEELEKNGLGKFKNRQMLRECGNTPATLTVVEQDGAMTIRISERNDRGDGLGIQINNLTGISKGDRLTVTGRIGEGAPKKSEWGIALHRSGTAIAHLAQHNDPKGEQIFFLTHLLDEIDVKSPILVITSRWGSETANPKSACMDFYIDDILITRSSKTGEAVLDERDYIYSMKNDKFSPPESRVGEITPFLFTSGDPRYEQLADENGISVRVVRRVNDWDGVDIAMSLMNLVPGNSYTITARVQIESSAEPGSMIMFQMLPGYVWRGTRSVASRQEIVLSHTLTESDVQNCETIRIATNPQGSSITFHVKELEVKNNRKIISKKAGVDNRELIYSLEGDLDARPGGPLGSTTYLTPFGNCSCDVLEKDGKIILYLSDRKQSWDALDIMLEPMGLLPGNKYTVTAKGRMDRDVPEESEIMLQVMPGFIWQNNQPIAPNQEFTVKYTLTDQDIIRAEAMRVVLNSAGQTASFSIHEITVVNEGAV